MSGGSAFDPLEIVDDPSDLIQQRSKRHEANGEVSTSPLALGEDTHAERLSSHESTSRRTLPAGFHDSGSSSASSSRRSLLPGQDPSSLQAGSNSSRPPKSASGSATSSGTASPSNQSKVWTPPPRPWEVKMRERANAALSAMQPDSANGSGSAIPTVSGSGARIPNELLQARRETSDTNQRRSQSSAAIDLTSDDVVDDEDEPQLVRVKQGDVISDETKNLGPVCVGIVSGVVLCMSGCPEPIASDSIAAKDPQQDNDPVWARANWPGASHWLTQPGFRPVMIRLRYVGYQYQQQTNANWSYGGHNPSQIAARGKPQLTVGVLLSPLAFQREQAALGVPVSARSAAAHIKDPFGTLSEKFTDALEPLLAQKVIQCEARCRLVERGQARNYIHPVQMLVFCNRPHVGLVGERLAQAGITLEQPDVGHYHASDYRGGPPLVNPHALGSGAGPAENAGNRFNEHMFMGGAGYGANRYVQSKEMTEEERRKQIETVYDQIIAGEELQLTSPSSLIKTDLFPHQKQGLTFLLDREKERSFDEAGEAGSSKMRSIDLTRAGDLTKDSVGLWKVIRSKTTGEIRGYRNVITQHEQDVAPHICRGAILADDMGLGKTITVISVIAGTMQEAKAFGKSEVTEASAQSSRAKEDEDDAQDVNGTESFAAGLLGSNSTKKRKALSSTSSSQSKKKKPGKREVQREDAEQARLRNLSTRSRATLIVSPLTIVSNWEEQIAEHWQRNKRPTVYIYHGSSRSEDPDYVANHDVVLTTYATLASEFANQSTWTEGAPSDGEKESDIDDEDDGGFEMYDAQGEVVSNNGKKPDKSKKKGKRKRAGGREAPNTLQRIEWFRIVLDEAHTIKEVRTMQCRAVCNLTAQRRLSLTGTPVQNRLDDLYAQIKFLRLEPFSDRFVWNEQCGQRQKKHALNSRSNANPNNEPLEQVALVKVQTIMKFLTLRRTKESRTATGEKLLELPAKNTRVVTITFDERERKKYRELHERYKEDFKEMEAEGTVGTNYATILQEISNLRICCDDPDLVDASKDMRRLRDGQLNISSAIREDGLSRARAARLFEVYSETDQAECGACGMDLSHNMDGSAGYTKEEASDDPLKAKAKPVLTRCGHVFCVTCWIKAVPEWKQLKRLKADAKCVCPTCDGTLAIIDDAIQLESIDLDGVTSARASPQDDTGDFSWGSDEDEPKPAKSRRGRNHGFGCDREVPVDDRIGLSHKTRFLLQDLIPFSRANPDSLLYDPSAPRIVHYVPTDAQRNAQPTLESVVATPLSADVDKYVPVKSVVFSQWTSMLDRVQSALQRAGIRSVRLDGKMRRPDRAAALEKFKSDPRVEVFLVSLRAGGFGLNLISACRAYCIEPAWNPAQEQQAMDRVHRLGQVNPVITTKIVTKDSIEERMIELQKRKQMLANKVAEKRTSASAATPAPTRAEEKEQRREEIRSLMA